MEKAKIRPLATPKPLNRSSQKLAGVITSWMAPGIRNFVARGFCSPNTWFCRAFGVTSMFVFLGSSIRLQPTPHGRIFMQNTSNDVVPCKEVPFGFSMTIFYIIGPLNFRKTAIFGNRFWLDSFLRLKTALTWGCSNIKLPLIVIVAP